MKWDWHTTAERLPRLRTVVKTPACTVQESALLVLRCAVNDAETYKTGQYIRYDYANGIVKEGFSVNGTVTHWIYLHRVKTKRGRDST